MELGDNQRVTGLKVPGLSVPGLSVSGCDSDALIHVGKNRLFFIGCHNYRYLRFSGDKSAVKVTRAPLTLK